MYVQDHFWPIDLLVTSEAARRGSHLGRLQGKRNNKFGNGTRKLKQPRSKYYKRRHRYSTANVNRYAHPELHSS